MAYEYGVNLKLNTEEAQKSIEKVLKQLENVEKAAGKITVKLDTKDVGKQVSSLSKMSGSLTKGTVLGGGAKADRAFKNVSSMFSKTGSFLSQVSEIGRDVSIGMRNFQSTVSGIMSGVLGTVENVGSRFLSLAEDYFSQALEQYQTMEQAEIGFGNLFTDALPEEISQTIVKTANKMAGVSANTLLGGVNILAPYTEGNSSLAIGAASGLMKAITYSGQKVSEVGQKALTNLGQLASGQFRGIADIRELYRQVPAIDKLLKSTTKGSELLDKKTGKLSTDKMRAFIKKYGSQAMLEVFQEIGESSAASDIFGKYGKTFSGSLQNLKDNIVSGMSEAFKQSGLAKTLSSEFVSALDKGGLVDKIKEKLASMMGGINEFVTQNMDKLKEIGRGFLAFLKDIGVAIGDAVTDLLKYLGVLDDEGKINLDGIKKLAQDASKFIKGMIEGFKDGLKGLGDTIKWISEHLGEEGWQKLGKIIGWILSPLGKLTTGLISLGAGVTKLLATLATATGSGLSKGGLLANLFGGGSAITAARNAYDSKVPMGEATSFGTKMKAATSAVGAFASKTLGAVATGGAIWSLTQVAGDAVEALELFGDNSEDVAGVVKTLGTELAFTIGGAMIGGISGGVIGAILGLGVAAAEAIGKINEKTNKDIKSLETILTNERDQSAYKLTMELLKQAGVDTDTESEEGRYANERLKKKIQESNGNFNFQELVNEFANALNFKKSAEGLVALTDTDAFKNAGGKAIDFDVDKDKRNEVAEMVKWYRLLGDDYNYNQSQERIVKDYLASGGYDTMTEEQYNMLMNGKTDVETAMSNQTTKLVENTTELEENAKMIREQILKSEVLTQAIANLDSTIDDFLGNFFGDNYKKWLNMGGTFEGQDVSSEQLVSVYEDKIKELSEKYNTETDESKREEIRKELADLLLRKHRYNPEEGRYTISPQILAESLAEYEWFADALRKKLGISKAMGGFITPIYRAIGGSARGIDTVPAMLSPGEYVIKSSAVSKAGLGVLDALNHGDLGLAARSLGARFSNSWNNSRSYTNTINNNQKTISQAFTINNRTRGGALNSYYSFANKMAASF